MQLDPLTLLAVSGVMAVLCGISFILNTSFRNNDATGRVWSVGFIAAVVSAMGLTVSEMNPENWIALIIGNMALPVAMGAMWAGSRLFNGRTSGFWIVTIISALVGLAVIVRGPHAGVWAGAVEFNIGVGILAGCAAWETSTRRLKRNVNGRIAAAVYAVASLFYILRSIALVTIGRHDPFFEMIFGTATITFVNLVLIVALTVALSILRAERASGGAVGDFTDGIHSAAGVLSASAFAQAAADHIDRAEMAPRGPYTIALIGADIDNLPELNIAFGRKAGDEAIARFAQTLRYTVPPTSLIGHPAAGRFLILVGIVAETEARAITEQIQMAQVDEPMGERQRIRLTASFGTATTAEYGYDLDALTAAVSQRIDCAKEVGNETGVIATQS